MAYLRTRGAQAGSGVGVGESRRANRKGGAAAVVDNGGGDADAVRRVKMDAGCAGAFLDVGSRSASGSMHRCRSTRSVGCCGRPRRRTTQLVLALPRSPPCYTPRMRWVALVLCALGCSAATSVEAPGSDAGPDPLRTAVIFFGCGLDGSGDGVGGYVSVGSPDCETRTTSDTPRLEFAADGVGPTWSVREAFVRYCHHESECEQATGGTLSLRSDALDVDLRFSGFSLRGSYPLTECSSPELCT